MLTNMIDQHYNHPSVIIWGLGNENDWPGDFPEFDKQAIRNFMSELNNQAHLLDPSRKTAIRRCDFCRDIVDVYSPSIWAGWYRGKYTEYLEESQKNRKQVDLFLHVEGENEIRAVGKSSGGIISDTISQNYVTNQWETPEMLDLQVVPVDRHSSWIVARLKDAKGNLCLDAKNQVEFSLIGDARLIDNQGTAAGSRKVELSNGMAKIKVVFDTDRWIASVKTQGIKTVFSSPGENRIEPK